MIDTVRLKFENPLKKDVSYAEIPKGKFSREGEVSVVEEFDDRRFPLIPLAA